MRKFLSWILSLAIIVSIYPVTASATEKLSLSVSKDGDGITVTYNVEKYDSVGSMESMITFPKEVVELVEVTGNEFSPLDFESPNISNANKTGIVKLGYSNETEDTATVSGTIATLTFKVLTGGTPGDYAVTLTKVSMLSGDLETDYAEADAALLPISAAFTIGGVTPPAHTCTLTKIEAKAATCTEDGNIEYYQCSDPTCGKLYKDAAGTQEITKEDTVIKAAHTGLKLYPAKEPTCDRDGCIAYWFCTGCDKYYLDNNGAAGAETTVEKVAISATGHSWTIVTKGEDNAETHVVECSVCHKTKDEAHVDRPGDVNDEWKSDENNHWHEFACGTIMDKAEHTWDAGVVTKEATCTEAGVKTFTCECGATKTEPISKIDHKYEWKHNESDHWQECTVCGDIIDKAAHTYPSHKCEDTATCTKAECGYVKPAGQHNWDAGKVTKEATCTETGEKLYTCKECKETKTETIPTIDHKYEWKSDETNHWEECSVCHNKKNEAEHQWGEGLVTKAATCTTDGEQKFTCTGCGRTKTEKIDALNHKMTLTPATAATCTEPGNSEYYTCGNCGKFFSDVDGKNEIKQDSWVIAALDHDFTGDWFSDASGHARKCTRCDATDTVVKHTYTGKPCTEEDKCTKCGYEKKAGTHAWGKVEYKWSVNENNKMSCTAAVKCTNCEAEEKDTAVIGIDTTPATCTVAGKTVYTATFSSNLFTTQTKEVTIKAPGHTVVEDAAKAATCTETGLTAGKHCSVCNEILVAQTVLPALGHKLTKTAAKAATCTETGNNEYWTCSVCNKVFKADKTTETTVAAETLPAPGHTLVKTEAKTPTCAAGGNNEYYTCSVCKKVFKADKTTETTVAKETLAKNPENHTGETETRGAVEASCMTAGRHADTYCKGCGKLTEPGEIIPATGIHKYVDGVCTTCGTKQPASGKDIAATIEKVVADAKEAVEKVLDEAIKNEPDESTKKILEKLKGFVSGSSRSKLQAVYNVTMKEGNTALTNGETLADAQNVTIAISEETYNALKSGAKIVESYLDKDGNAQTREINATVKPTGDGGYTVTFSANKTAAYGLMTKTSSGGSGSGGSYTSGKTFTTDLPAGSITSVSVNGKKLDSKYYVISGSDVTLTDAYLATLKAGKYTIRIENATHVSTGTFTITADGALSSPKTADAGIALYAMLAVSSLMGTAVVSKKRRKA